MPQKYYNIYSHFAEHIAFEKLNDEKLFEENNIIAKHQ
jgi:hypothetical protein